VSLIEGSKNSIRNKTYSDSISKCKCNKLFESPILLNFSVYTAGKSDLLEGSINNGQFIQIETVQTGYSIRSFDITKRILFR